MLTLLCLLLLSPSSAQTAPQGAWKAIKSSTGGFTLEMPGQPREEKKSFKTSQGPVEATLMTLEVKKGGTLGVTFTQWKQSKAGQSIDERLDKAAKEMVTSTKGKLINEKKIKLSDDPGRELLIDVDGKRSVRARLFARENSFYELLVIGSRDWVSSGDAERFLDSFVWSK